MIGLMQSASFFIMGMLLVYLGLSLFKVGPVAAILLMITGATISVVSTTALEDYGLWLSAMALFGLMVVGVAVINIPWFRQNG